MKRLNRRMFLRASALAGGALVASPWRALASLGETVAPSGVPVARHSPNNGGYGPLRPAGPELALPEGFSYVRFGGEGTPMSNGRPTPGAHDGMAAFPGPGGTVRLVRNHEVDGTHAAFAGAAYDAKGGGGATNLVFDPGVGRLLACHPSLTGTVRNCAGGRTPWGTWLSCEETTDGAADGYDRPHGYCFEVPAGATAPVQALPLRDMGRFKHEAVCVDKWGDVYLTEDQDAAGFYRFRPRVKGALAAGGRLEMLAVSGRPGYDTRRGQQLDQVLPVSWVGIPDPDPHDAGWHPQAVFRQGRDQGAAVFSRLEGCFWHRGRAVIVATEGGNAGLGQVWEYRPGDNFLSLAFESSSADFLRNPDNVVATPRGGLLLCEDCGGPDRIQALDDEGRAFEFARNRFSDGEFTGTTFSPDGKVLFVNVQRPGVTFAITGPWARGAL
ncbi:MAG: alkaline phosphatase PhoX [Acidimicrobiia bacterium]